MEEALARICVLDRGQSFLDVALAIIRLEGIRDQREHLLQALVWVLENQLSYESIMGYVFADKDHTVIKCTEDGSTFEWPRHTHPSNIDGFAAERLREAGCPWPAPYKPPAPRVPDDKCARSPPRRNGRAGSRITRLRRLGGVHLRPPPLVRRKNGRGVSFDMGRLRRTVRKYA